VLSQADPALLASGYTRPRDADYSSLHSAKAYPYNRIHSPSSDLMSSIADMVRWAQANLNRGKLDGKRILKASTYDVMWKPAVEVEFCRGGDRSSCRKPGAEVGISWFLEKKDGQMLVSHSGGDHGFVSDLVLIPDANMGLVLMCNSEHPGISLPQKIVRAFYELARQSDHPAN